MESSISPSSWKNSLGPEMRESLRKLHELSLWTTLKIPVLLGLWLVFGFLAVKIDNLALRIPCWLIIGYILHSLGIFMHEGAQGSLFRRGILDRIVGFACGIPIFFPCSSYRATHLLHHKFENTSKDPDNLNANLAQPFFRAALFYFWLLFGMPIYVALISITGPFRAEGWKNKLAAVLEPLLIAGFFYILFGLSGKYGWGDVLVNGWAMAIPFAVIVANFRGMSEHTQLKQSNPPDPFKTTRSLPSSKITSFFFNNQNYHLEHHLFPGVPWNNLDKVHRLLVPIYRERRASICANYLIWARDALRFGPLRTISYDPQFQPTLDPLPSYGMSSLPVP